MKTSVMTRVVARVLLVPALVVALAILIKGYADTGDGFNAGVIAALGMLLQYVAFGYEEAERMMPVRLVAVIAFGGLLLSLAVALLPLFWGLAIFTHVPGPGEEVIHLGTVELITPVVFDIGVFMLVFGFAVGAIDLLARAIHRRET
ncbi:MnhB domain-containing protein [Rubrobacter taiwanensis]|nr:MnhB domain-containing protein [Rubrobacter taiwanensis]